MPECRTCMGTSWAYQEMVSLTFRNITITDGVVDGHLVDVSEAILPQLVCERCGDVSEVPGLSIDRDYLIHQIEALLRYRPKKVN